MQLTNFPNGIQAFPVIGASSMDVFGAGKILFVDGDLGSDGNDGLSPQSPKVTVQSAVTAAGANSTIYVKAKAMAAGATDPGSYAENIIIPAGSSCMTIIGVGSALTQGALPQLKVGATTTSPIITVRAAGFVIQNMTVNGIGATGGGILLDGDASTKDAFGFAAINCYLKNCKGSGAAATGGAIYWSSTGSSWNVRIDSCDFYDCRAGIVLTGTSIDMPKSVYVENCSFGAGLKATVDCDIYGAGGSGINGLYINKCRFNTVDVPAYATSPSAARYVYATGCVGAMTNCTFACTGKTIGAAGDACYIPVTMRTVACYQENAIFTRT
jgi:hypothetical protein